ncbi:putative transcription initiation factor iia gamma chain [Diplodia seriata]|uniref:Transcription initiation factor IIA subunit 2 n=3 Tax=Botryosphaeriaceae TaxID=45131 RepID=A0A0G2GUC8_9PEZI|nr:Transcription initiation factor iia gamma chain [Lasiodiplodia theobromae]KAB2579424.1 Transcription initiation factor IIA subunit 2 [Lasiodiplodia theobromae]KAF4542278.1 Transcription initiation factor iia gamma chain [Lasiodiplodia theobromae]KAK0664992.1 Transcription initiation factor IIA subunit 2 [Lasiodiplodia hormozganensis]KKY26858.1 putative transcription initiation factor iia gamma chain [Diplodia seriata]
MSDLNYYEIYRKTSIGLTLMDTLDELISTRRMEPQLAIKIMQNFDKALADVISEKVKARMSFKGHLDTYRFCDDVWTFIIKDITFKMDNSQSLTADKIKIVSNNSSRPGN